MDLIVQILKVLQIKKLKANSQQPTAFPGKSTKCDSKELFFFSLLSFFNNRMRILFVCLGNICRSPAAEGIFTNLIEIHGLGQSVSCDSAGTSGYNEGDGAWPKMNNIAWERGYKLTSISRRINPLRDFGYFDLIVGMDEQNIRDLTRMAPDAKAKAKICKMTDYCSRHNDNVVPDPYYGDTRDYELVIDLLEDACEGLIQSITKK